MERFLKRKAPDINREEEIKHDLGLRKEIDAYHPNQRERVSGKEILGEWTMPTMHVQFSLYTDWGKRQSKMVLAGMV